MKEVKQWLQNIYNQGFICHNYKNRIERANTKEDLFKIVCDSNGVSFLQSLECNDVDIPFDMLKFKFKNYINGKNKPVYIGRHNEKYTSCLYLNCDEKLINIDTSLVSFINYSGVINIKKDMYCGIVLSKNCDVEINIFGDTKIKIYAFNKARFSVNGDINRVIIEKCNGREF